MAFLVYFAALALPVIQILVSIIQVTIIQVQAVWSKSGRSVCVLYPITLSEGFTYSDDMQVCQSITGMIIVTGIIVPALILGLHVAEYKNKFQFTKTTSMIVLLVSFLSTCIFFVAACMNAVGYKSFCDNLTQGTSLSCNDAIIFATKYADKSMFPKDGNVSIAGIACGFIASFAGALYTLIAFVRYRKAGILKSPAA